MNEPKTLAEQRELTRSVNEARKLDSLLATMRVMCAQIAHPDTQRTLAVQGVSLRDITNLVGSANALSLQANRCQKPIARTIHESQMRLEI